jgi:hypothetical protein
MGVVAQTSNPSYSGRPDRRITSLRPAWAIVRPSQKQKAKQNKTTKGLKGVAKVIERLPSRHEALGSFPNTEKIIVLKANSIFDITLIISLSSYN